MPQAVENDRKGSISWVFRPRKHTGLGAKPAEGQFNSVRIKIQLFNENYLQ
jgi:hypothetical protein